MSYQITTCNGQHVLCPPRLTGRGGTGHTKNPRALGGESSFCGAGAAIYSEKHLYSFVETVARRQLSSALPVSPLPIPPISHKKAFLQNLSDLEKCFFHLSSHLHTSCNRYTICEALFHSVPPGDSHIGTPGVLFRNFALPT